MLNCQVGPKMYFPTIKDDIHSAVLARELVFFFVFFSLSDKTLAPWYS